MPPAMPPEPIRRSIMVTLVAWGMMLMGALGLPISGITALMLLAKSYGTANAGFLDSCVMVLGPLGVLTLGFGLLRRWRWALLGTVVLLAVIGVHQGWTLACGPSETKTYTTESGGEGHGNECRPPCLCAADHGAMRRAGSVAFVAPGAGGVSGQQARGGSAHLAGWA
jgi:hypothetical protein